MGAPRPNLATSLYTICRLKRNGFGGKPTARTTTTMRVMRADLVVRRAAPTEEYSMSKLDMSQANTGELHLPFKPFTRDEVGRITQVPGHIIDAWWGRALPERMADIAGHMPGLDFMQTFAVYAAYRWLKEGADMERATGLIVFVSNLGKGVMLSEFRAGNTFPSPTPYGGVLVPHHRLGSLGERCNLLLLYREFEARVQAVFPSPGK